jgi:hypothetical protein
MFSHPAVSRATRAFIGLLQLEAGHTRNKPIKKNALRALGVSEESIILKQLLIGARHPAMHC